ncbi:MAG TPA: hypothetical protein H9742_03110 [Candidatus Acetatifactor stercoripullorum]|uniref:Uncharacterized protein n=1 Tax=Candidatus Acetatifactor stercoripullorum TaxID=2838414 RepID=A0A9D1R3C2_9FIRM|nr:hypothetical protein [Candidatus Acetatifactor stercoripullorum]HIW80509.1 hypothetical protein [Candidatus Acetatifactor stercoripullorum]
MGSEDKKEIFSGALQGKKIPILTLDNKWYRLLDETGRTAAGELTEHLNELLRRQGKLNTESKEIRKLKKKLMSEIVPMVNEAEQSQNAALEQKIEDNKRLIAECNEKLEKYQDEMLELPGEIDRVNFQLMLFTMECCYRTMKENQGAIQEITDWVTQVRIDLKKNLIRRQEMEQQNQEIYSYMHDVFGADVVDLFDMSMLPENSSEK